MNKQQSAQAPVSGHLNAPTRALSPREWEVLELLVEGNSNRLIAIALKLSVKTVEKHRQKMMDKLGIHHITGLTRYAMASGITEIPAPFSAP